VTAPFPRSLGVLHPTFEEWGGAEWYLHQSTSWLVHERGVDATVYTHRFVDPPGERPAYRVACHRRGGYASAPWDWRRIGREIAGPAREHDVLLLHNYPATVWYGASVAAGLGPGAVWFCHEPPRSLHPAETPVAETPPTDRPRGDATGALRFYGARAPRRAVSRLAAAGAERWGGALWRAALVRRERAAVALVSEIVANSAYTAQRVERIYGRAARVIHPLAPDLRTIAGPAAEPKERLVLCVGRMTEAKRPELLLDAWERAAAESEGLRGMRLVFVGDGPLRPRLAARAERSGLAVDVEHGLPRAAVIARYRRALLTVHLGVDEPFGLVPVESMAAGTAVLAHAGGGVPETVVHGETGWCEPLDRDTLARWLARLPELESRLVEMGRRGAEHVRRHFDPERALGELADALARAAAHRAQA
jgi:glycosyltransferase involved in cell wall biosynthesis